MHLAISKLLAPSSDALVGSLLVTCKCSAPGSLRSNSRLGGLYAIYFQAYDLGVFGLSAKATKPNKTIKKETT